MGIASGMKDLSDQITASHNVRIKALGDLVMDTRKTLKDFAEERQNMGRKQSKDLLDFVDGLSKGVNDMLKGFQKDRKKMGSEQSKDLSDFAAKLTQNVKNMIGDFHKDHQHMSDEQAKNLSDFVNDLTRDVSSIINSFRKERGEMSAELKSKLAGDVKNIETYVKNKLKEFEKSHGKMSDALRKSLAAYANDMASGVRKLLQEYNTDMKQAKSSWETISTLTGLKVEAAMPSVKFAGKVATVQETIEKKEPQAEEIHHDVDIEAKVLGYINEHPEGTKAGDMEPVFGITRMRLGVLAKKLLDEGKIRKEDSLYYPL